jgi:hypothetical protein
MGYTFTCDACGEGFDHAPPFMGEFRESFLKTAPSILAEVYSPGETVTMCQGCSEQVFL